MFEYIEAAPSIVNINIYLIKMVQKKKETKNVKKTLVWRQKRLAINICIFRSTQVKEDVMGHLIL